MPVSKFTPSGREFIEIIGNVRDYYFKNKMKRIYVYRGQSNDFSAQYRGALKEGKAKLPANSPYVYNEFTRRIVKRDSLYKKNNQTRKAYQTQLDTKLKQKNDRFTQLRENKMNDYIVKRFRSALPMGDWKQHIRDQVSIQDYDKPFRVKIKSGVLNGVEKIFDFKNMFEYEFWVDKMTNGEVAGSDPKRAESAQQMGVFDLATLTHMSYDGGCNHCNNEQVGSVTKKHENSKFIFELYNPTSQRNDCGLKCIEHILGKKLSCSSIRKKFNLKANSKIPFDTLFEIYQSIKTKNDGMLQIIDDMFCGKIDMQSENYILLQKEHYYVIQNVTEKPYNNCKVKRGDLTFDFETRPCFGTYSMVGSHKSYHLKDTICAIHYRHNRSDVYNEKVFITNHEKSSARQLLDWLQEEHYEKRHYNMIAHNGANFDNYFLSSNFTELETQQTEYQMRGASIIGIQYFSHLIKDSCCFLTNSLNNLCKNFKVKTKKLTEFEHNGIMLTNANLCFYKPELDFWDFMDLQHTDTEYWKLYTDYCMHDCLSLTEIWASFKKETNDIIEKMDPSLLQKCNATSCNTIGSLSKKLMDNIVKLTPQTRKDFKIYKDFIGVDDEKYQFICGFKRGGISHCNQMGRHEHEVCSYDITSQYPTAMKYMKIPAGRSNWVTEFDHSKHGYYIIKNLVFSSKKDKKFRCISSPHKEKKSLDWAHNWEPEDEIKIGSELLKYCMETQGLVSFDVVKGLVSNNYLKGYQLFGRYVKVLFDAKAQQDIYKKAKDPRYNQALREVIKLLLNSVTGKLVENPARYFKLEFTSDNSKQSINGVGVLKTPTEKTNLWVNAGCCVYDYSKILLFKYIECLPNGSDDVIHVETDSIYFNKKDEEAFIQNVAQKSNENPDYPICISDDLGNVKQEHTTGTNVSYFLGKKFYCLEDDDGIVFKIKGIPCNTIDISGNKVEIVNKNFYERIYAGETIISTYSTLKKTFFSDTKITSHYENRTTRPAGEYLNWK